MPLMLAPMSMCWSDGFDRCTVKESQITLTDSAVGKIAVGRQPEGSQAVCQARLVPRPGENGPVHDAHRLEACLAVKQAAVRPVSAAHRLACKAFSFRDIASHAISSHA